MSLLIRGRAPFQYNGSCTSAPHPGLPPDDTQASSNYSNCKNRNISQRPALWSVGQFGLTFLPLLKLVLKNHGFFKENAEVIRDLKHAAEAIELVKFILSHLPPYIDLLDAFQYLDFGDKRPKDHKDANATLRTLGMYATREYDPEESIKGEPNTKLKALLHPIGRRGSSVTTLVSQLKAGLLDLDTIEDKDAIPRLRVEIYVARQYLTNPRLLRFIIGDILTNCIGKSQSGNYSKGYLRDVLEAQLRRFNGNISSIENALDELVILMNEAKSESRASIVTTSMGVIETDPMPNSFAA